MSVEKGSVTAWIPTCPGTALINRKFVAPCQRLKIKINKRIRESPNQRPKNNSSHLWFFTLLPVGLLLTGGIRGSYARSQSPDLDPTHARQSARAVFP